MTYVRTNSLLTPYERALLHNFHPQGQQKSHQLRVNIREEEGHYELQAEIPGLTEKDIEVKVEDNLLTIASLQKEEGEKDGKYLMKERRRLHFTRSFVLPKDVDRDQITAAVSRGMLTLEVRKAEKALPREIEIKGI